MVKFKDTFIIFGSIVMAWLLMLFHLPSEWQWMRPEFLTLVLIYWVFTQPQSLGVGIAWLAGLGMDILDGSLLGSHALAMSIVVYFSHQLRNRIRFFPFWQQTFVVLVLVGIGKLTLVAVQWLIGQPPRNVWYWVSTLSSVVFWPIIYRFLHYYERRTIG